MSEVKPRPRIAVTFICKKCTNQCSAIIEHNSDITDILGVPSPYGCLYPSEDRTPQWEMQEGNAVRYQREGEF